MAVVSPKQPWTYENEEAAAGAAFHLAPLTHAQHARLIDLEGHAETAYEAAVMSITGWSGIRDDADADVSFDRDEPRKSLELLEWPLVMRIGNEVMLRCLLGRDDRKN